MKKDYSKDFKKAQKEGRVVRGKYYKKITKDYADFIAALVVMKNTAGKLGLYKTMHELEKPIKMVGWELAEKQTGKEISC